MKATLVILVLEALVLTGAIAANVNLLSEDFVNFHNSRTDVTWEVRILNITCNTYVLKQYSVKILPGLLETFEHIISNVRESMEIHLVRLQVCTRTSLNKHV